MVRNPIERIKSSSLTNPKYRTLSRIESGIKLKVIVGTKSISALSSSSLKIHDCKLQIAEKWMVSVNVAYGTRVSWK